MSTKLEIKQMCDVIIEMLNWIDSAEDSILVQELKQYRQELQNYHNIYIDGTMPIFPLDPRIK